MSETQNILESQVQAIADMLENGFDADDLNLDGEAMTWFDWLADCLDITYIIASDRTTVNGARILVSYGGPNIWVDTETNVVEGHWGYDRAVASFPQNNDLDEAVSELFACC